MFVSKPSFDFLVVLNEISLIVESIEHTRMREFLKSHFAKLCNSHTFIISVLLVCRDHKDRVEKTGVSHSDYD